MVLCWFLAENGTCSWGTCNRSKVCLRNPKGEFSCLLKAQGCIYGKGDYYVIHYENPLISRQEKRFLWKNNQINSEIIFNSLKVAASDQNYRCRTKAAFYIITFRNPSGFNLSAAIVYVNQLQCVSEVNFWMRTLTSFNIFHILRNKFCYNCRNDLQSDKASSEPLTFWDGANFSSQFISPSI